MTRPSRLATVSTGASAIRPLSSDSKLNSEVFAFYENLGKWFLHFSEPDSLSKAILPKKNRNLGDRKTAVIYRRGVRVREWSAFDTESLFDYNLNGLSLDEARKASRTDGAVCYRKGIKD